MIKEIMMKWRVRRESRCSSIDQEDVRRSLEILDNVLAEFDDSGFFFTDGSFGEQNHDDVILRSRGVTETSDLAASETSSLDSLRTCSTDGSTSQFIPSCQSRRFSPPPVPKRSPGTRLSAREGQFGSHTSWGSPGIPTPTSEDSGACKQRRNDDKASDNIGGRALEAGLLSARQGSSPSNQTNGELSSSPDSGPRSTDGAGPHCSRCGCLVLAENAPPKMNTGLFRSPSVAKRREHFEKPSGLSKKGCPKQFLNSDSGLNALPVTNSPFLKRKGRGDGKQGGGGPLVSGKLTNSLSDSKINEISSWVGRDESSKNAEQSVCRCPGRSIDKFDDVTGAVLSDRTNLDPGMIITPEEQIRRLNEKFAEVKRLLKEKKICALSRKPPNFVPPPPPKPPRKQKNSLTTNDATKAVSDSRPRHGSSIDSGSPKSPSVTHRSSDQGSSFVSPGDEGPSNKSSSSIGTPKLEPLSHTIEDLPKLLPTDALLRPQYGLSYTMEDDLSPGIKEILTSTPKPEKIQLSTFSQSVSSLGYGSSQSEQDLNVSFENDEKVPITTLKSQTLPIGMRLVPPLSCVEDVDSDSLDSCELHRSIDLFKTEEDHFRSSSAPPLKHLLKPEKKSVFGMSKKEKHRSKSGDDQISAKLNSSTEDCSRRSTVDGSTSSNSPDPKGKETPPEGKRRSVWKSILRRK